MALEWKCDDAMTLNVYRAQLSCQKKVKPGQVFIPAKWSSVVPLCLISNKRISMSQVVIGQKSHFSWDGPNLVS